MEATVVVPSIVSSSQHCPHPPAHGMQVDDAAKSGRPLEAAEVRVQLEAHGRMVAKWLARAGKLLERVQGLRLRSESPGDAPPHPHYKAQD